MSSNRKASAARKATKAEANGNRGRDKGRRSRERRPRRRFGKETLAVAKHQKTLALQTALLEHGAEPAMVLVILGLMGATSTARIQRCARDIFDAGEISPAIRAVFEKYRPRFGDCLDGDSSGGCGLRLKYWEEDSQAKALKVLCELEPREMHELFTAFVASTLCSSAGINAAHGDTALAVRLASILNADVASHWKEDKAFLKSCDRATLFSFALTMGLHLDEPERYPVEKMRQLNRADLHKAITTFINTHPERLSRLPLCFQFGTEQDLEALSESETATAAKRQVGAKVG